MARFDALSFIPVDELSDHMQSVQELLDGVATKTPAPLRQPITRILSAPGKRLRPALAIAAAAAYGHTITPDVLTCAAAIECVHVGTLIHDDIMDSAKTRRGVPAINSLEGPGTALLAGDYLLASAHSLAASVSSRASSIVADVIHDMCIGQAMELTSLHDQTRSVEHYFETIRLKTARLLASACRIGCETVDTDQHQADRISAVGETFGMVFQIVDDVFDIAGSEQLLGKTPGSDIAGGVYTMPTLIALQSHPSQLAKQLHTPNDGNDTLRSIVQHIAKSGAITAALDYARTLADDGVRKTPDDSAVLSALCALPGQYITWAETQLSLK